MNIFIFILTTITSTKRLSQYKKSLTEPLQDATVSYLLREGNVLLGMKKRGFGTGKWNGFGGKRNPGECIEDTAVREVEEEAGIHIKSQTKKAVLDFYFIDAPEWGQRVTAFLISDWEGEPQETEEMAPQWYPLKKLPYSNMWADGKHWLPMVLIDGKTVTGEFLFNKEGELLEFTITEVDDII